jgi:hypothetical protein
VADVSVKFKLRAKSAPEPGDDLLSQIEATSSGLEKKARFVFTSREEETEASGMSFSLYTSS